MLFGLEAKNEHINIITSTPWKNIHCKDIKDEKRLQNRLSSMGIICGSELEVCQNKKKQTCFDFCQETLSLQLVEKKVKK